MSQRDTPDVYKTLEQIALLLAGFALLALAASMLPSKARAFWPFSTGVASATSAAAPSASTPALVATINSNPNASTPIALATSEGALVAYSGPAGTMADVASTTQSDRISVYVVRPGDTLSEIGQMFGVSVNTIIWANNLSGPSDIHPGDTLIILPVSGVQHTIQKGDTLKSIARRYNADANEIAQYNGLNPAAPLPIGTTITIPGGELSVPSTPSPAARKSAVPSKIHSGGIHEPYLGGSGPALNGFFANPVPGGIITQGIHGWDAVDIGAPVGTPIHAAAAGKVIIARDNGAWNGGYGNYVVVNLDNGVQTLYAHMKRAAVHAGETVGKDQIIGYVGMTGWTTGPHVHFEVRGAANPFRNCPVGDSCSPQ